MTDENEELRPSKMRGVAFPKAKYGVILGAGSDEQLGEPSAGGRQLRQRHRPWPQY